MPLFDFTCSGCATTFEALVASNRAKPACPHCGAKKCARHVSAAAVHGASRAAPMLPSLGCGAQGCGAIERPPSEGCGASSPGSCA